MRGRVDEAQRRIIGEAVNEDDAMKGKTAFGRQWNQRSEIDAQSVVVFDSAEIAVRNGAINRGGSSPFTDSDRTPVRNQLVRRRLVTSVLVAEKVVASRGQRER